MTSTVVFLLISSRIVYLFVHSFNMAFLDTSSSGGWEAFFFYLIEKLFCCLAIKWN